MYTDFPSPQVTGFTMLDFSSAPEGDLTRT
jgi:hypothetical protein